LLVSKAIPIIVCCNLVSTLKILKHCLFQDCNIFSISKKNKKQFGLNFLRHTVLRSLAYFSCSKINSGTFIPSRPCDVCISQTESYSRFFLPILNFSCKHKVFLSYSQPSLEGNLLCASTYATKNYVQQGYQMLVNI